MSTQSKKPPKLIQIYIASHAGEPMQMVDHVQAVEDLGLVGDRYWKKVGFWQTLKNARPAIRHVSFISREDINAANAEAGTAFTPEETRRNFLIEGFGGDLRKLIGIEFRVGQVLFRGAEECTPCGRPSQLSGKKFFEKAFRANGRGGLRAQILNSGTIRIGDSLLYDEE